MLAEKIVQTILHASKKHSAKNSFVSGKIWFKQFLMLGQNTLQTLSAKNS